MSSELNLIRTEIIPYLFYRDVPAAVAWLTRAFGFAEDLRVPTPGGMHAEMSLDGRRIMMGQAPHAADAAPTQGVFVYLPDVDALAQRAEAAGAQVERAPHDESYGRTCTIHDLDGHPWYFTTPPG